MRILNLSSHFAPRACGVADYSYRLTQELVRQGHILSVLTAETDRPSGAYAFDGQFDKTNRFWGWQTFRFLLRRIKAFHPDVILIQYTPQSLAPATLGLWPTFFIWVWLMKKLTNCRVAVIVHELNYPVELTLRGIILGFPQFFQFWLLAFTSELIFFSTEYYFHWTRKYLFFLKGVHWLNVGATLRISDPREATPKSGSKLMVHFGGLHPTHTLEPMVEALWETQKHFGTENVRLVFVGVSQEALEKQFTLTYLGQSKSFP